MCGDIGVGGVGVGWVVDAVRGGCVVDVVGVVRGGVMWDVGGVVDCGGCDSVDVDGGVVDVGVAVDVVRG